MNWVLDDMMHRDPMRWAALMAELDDTVGQLEAYRKWITGVYIYRLLVTSEHPHFECIEEDDVMVVVEMQHEVLSILN